MYVKLSIKLIVMSYLITLPFVVNASGLKDLNIIFINGIQNTPKLAKKNAEKTAVSLGLDINDVKSIYNSSKKYSLADLIETFDAGTFDGIQFWKFINNQSENMPDKFKQEYKKMITENYISGNPDLTYVFANVDLHRDLNKKLLIVSHSEGTIFSNIVMKRLIDKYGEDAKMCTKLVSVATPVNKDTGIRNDGLYITSSKDIVVQGASVFLDSLKPNIETHFDFNADLGLGHSYTNIYLSKSHPKVRKKVIDSIFSMGEQINNNCLGNLQACGKELSVNDGRAGNGQWFSYTIKGKSKQKIVVSFEAFFKKDSITAFANNYTLIASAPLSGFHEYVIDFDPSKHGNRLDFVIDAPQDGTNWKLCVNCDNSENTCAFVVNRKSISIMHTNHSAAECSKTVLYVDGIPVNDYATNKYTKGKHILTWNNPCNCKTSNCYYQGHDTQILGADQHGDNDIRDGITFDIY